MVGQYDVIACSNSEATEKAAPEPTLETTQPPHGGEQPHDTQAQQQESTSIGAYNIIRSENMQDMNQKKKRTSTTTSSQQRTLYV